MSATGRRGHLAGRRGEHEPDGVGPHAHGQQGVVLAGDPADLDERRRRPRRRRRTSRRAPGASGRCPPVRPRPPPGRRSGDQGLADQHGAVAGVGQARRRRPPADARLGHRHHVRRVSGGASRSARSVSTSKVREVALVHADQVGPGAPAPGRARPRRAPPPGRPGRGRRPGAPARPARRRPRAATMSRTASAPMSTGVAHVGGAHGEVLAQHRQAAGRPGGRRGRPGEPPKKCRSVSTDRQAAPPAWYSRATAAGSRSAARSPFDGERRLTSAITAIRPGPPGHERGREVAVGGTGRRRPGAQPAGVPPVARGRLPVGGEDRRRGTPASGAEPSRGPCSSAAR